jgi:hypothetical protein
VLKRLLFDENRVVVLMIRLLVLLVLLLLLLLLLLNLNFLQCEWCFLDCLNDDDDEVEVDEEEKVLHLVEEE